MFSVGGSSGILFGLGVLFDFECCCVVLSCVVFEVDFLDFFLKRNFFFGFSFKIKGKR